MASRLDDEVGRWVGRFAGDVGDDVGGEVAQFAVAVLRCLAQQVERGGGGAPLLAHENPDGLIDDTARGDRFQQLLLYMSLVDLA
jgi:hypothetical protein